MSNSGVPDMLLTWHFGTVLLYMCVHPDHRAECRQVRASFPVSLAMSRQCKYRYFCNSISELCSSISVRKQIKTIK